MNLLLSIFFNLFFLTSLTGVLASDCDKPVYDHEHKEMLTSNTEVFLKEAERKKLKYGSIYELVVDLDQWSSLLNLPLEEKRALGLALDTLPRLEKRDRLALRAVNTDFRKKFIILHNINDEIDLAISVPLSLNKINTTRYPFNSDHTYAFDEMPFESKETQMACDLMKEGLLRKARFAFKNQNKHGFRTFLGAAALHQEELLLRGLEEGFVAEIPKKLTENSPLVFFGVSYSGESKEDVHALKEIIQKSKKLKVLSFRDSYVFDEGAGVIAEALKSNGSIVKVDLCGNGITNIGAQKLGDMLAHNKALEILDPYNNKLTMQDINQLRKAAKKNTTLKTVYIGGNNFHNDPNRIQKLNNIHNKDKRFWF